MRIFEDPFFGRWSACSVGGRRGRSRQRQAGENSNHWDSSLWECSSQLWVGEFYFGDLQRRSQCDCPPQILISSLTNGPEDPIARGATGASAFA